MHILNHFSDDEYFHLPDVQRVDGLLDLISGCTLAILGNVLDFRTYSAPNQAEEDPKTREQQRLWKDFDRNDIPGDEHMAICYARGIALAVIQWIRTWCIVKDPVGEVLDDLPSKQIVELLGALLAYKANAATRRLDGAPHCALWMLRAQVLNVVGCDSLVEKLWKGSQGKSSNSLRMTLDEGCTVEWKDDTPHEFHKASKFFSAEFILRCSIFSAMLYQQDGMTAFDRKYLDGEQHRSQLDILSMKM